jgi:hypothetical protein
MKQPVATPLKKLDRDEKGVLAEHLQSCVAALGPGFRLRYVAEAVHNVIAPRFVTTVCVSCLVLFSAMLAL